ncbi:ABC transporter ATP-binding protein [Natrinema sp. 1APR25-10V2]|uniref:ABC transporter ATP-binding protein n=1 Tax=Natrinema sp. 1APR25-10V2 TaxID=2951081 RepID=UPI0028754CFA|nr:ABC transporter ATP-binding protein [Natrinema sp. 1APR25-10V2]MDS0477309.1 ABC transporter ATP-binding protein [Natrinema sp. 1APR25-10V2]
MDSKKPTSENKILKAENIEAGYGESQVLRDLSFELEEGEILSIVGPNGAGKTTLMRVLMGLITPSDGSIQIEDETVTDTSVHDRVGRGLSLASEERNLFQDMSVKENLILGSYPNRGENRSERIDRVFELFPRLKERQDQQAGTLSGGEAQMLAIGRALMTDIRILLLDEPSLGLAPKLIPELFAKIREINEKGISVVLVEQRAKEALELADSGCLIEDGTIVHRGKASDMASNDEVIEKYLGGA